MNMLKNDVQEAVVHDRVGEQAVLLAVVHRGPEHREVARGLAPAVEVAVAQRDDDDRRRP